MVTWLKEHEEEHFWKGLKELKIFGKYYAVKASIYHEESLSAHADQKELLDWMDSIKNIPERVFLIHGEQEALLEFKIKIADVYKWHVHIPEIFETVELIF